MTMNDMNHKPRYYLRPLPFHGCSNCCVLSFVTKCRHVIIPPVAPALLACNPKFDWLHHHLTNHALDPDASTTAINGSHQFASDQLRLQRVRAAEDRLQAAALFELGTSEDLPSDLRDLILIIASYVADAGKLGLNSFEQGLMQSYMAAFRERLDEIAEALARSVS